MESKNDYLIKLVEIMEIDVKNMQCPGTDNQKIVMGNILSQHLSTFEEAIKYEASKIKRPIDYLLKLTDMINIDVKSMQCPGTDNQKLIIANRLSTNMDNLKKVVEYEVNISHIEVIKSKLNILADNDFKTSINCDLSKSHIEISILPEKFIYNRSFINGNTTEKRPRNLIFTINRKNLNKAEDAIDKYISLIKK